MGKELLEKGIKGYLAELLGREIIRHPKFKPIVSDIEEKATNARTLEDAQVIVKMREKELIDKLLTALG